MTNDSENNNVIVRKSGLAIASMILGIASIVLVVLTSIVFSEMFLPEFFSITFFVSFVISVLLGLAFGIITLFRIHKSNGTLTGRGMAIAGIVTSSSIPSTIIIFLVVWFFISTQKLTATRRVYAPVYRSELRTPVTSGSAQPLKETGKIYIKDHFIFVNELSKGVHVINNRDPSKPEIIAFLNIPGNVDIAIRNNVLYADSRIDLVVIDISNPTNISEVRRIENVFPYIDPTLFKEELGRNVRFKRINKRKGIVVGWELVGFETYTYRTSIGCFPPGTEVLTADGPRAIETVEPGTEVYAFDLSSGEWTLAKVLKRQSFQYEGDMISIRTDQTTIQATGNHPFYVLSGDRLASRPLPQDVPKEELRTTGRGRWVEARDLKEGDVLQDKGGEGVIITRLSSRHEKTEVYNLTVEGYHNYAVHHKGILVHNAKRREAAASPSTGKGGSLARFTIVDDYLYTLSGSALQLFDIKNPAAPSVWKKIEIGWDIETIFPYEDKLFIGGQEGMYIYDNSNPAEPDFISRFVHVTSCDPVVVEGNYAYVTLRGGTRCGGWNNRLDIIDISAITNPKLIADYPMNGPYGLGIDGGALFIADGSAGLKLFDASDPRNLKLIRDFRGIHPLDVILADERAIVVGKDGLYQYDYQDLENVELISKIPTK